MPYDPFLMKKLLKSEVCESSEQCTRLTSVHSALKKSHKSRLKKKKKKERKNVGTLIYIYIYINNLINDKLKFGICSQ